MAFDPTCMPPLPSCAEDMTSWANQLITCLATNFTAAFSNIAAVAVPQFNICEEIESLGPNCYLTHEGIDQTNFTYATGPDQVIAGNGVLPEVPRTTEIEYRAGAFIMSSDTCTEPGSHPVIFEHQMSTANYAVFLTLGNDVVDVFLSAPNEQRARNRFQVMAKPRDCDSGEYKDCWVYWLAIKINT